MPRSAPIATLAFVLFAAGCSESSGPDGFFGCESVARYEIGETTSGTVLSSDCVDPNEFGFADYYQFRQSSPGPVSAVVEVPEGSARMFVAIFNEHRDIVDVRFIEPGEESSVGGQLDDGTYFIVVGTVNPGSQSTYNLTTVRDILLARPAFLTCTEQQDYTYGSTVTDTLVIEDCLTPDAGLMDLHRFTLDGARTVTIYATSGAFDSFLYLFNSEGGILAWNDDIGGSTNSRIIVPLPAGTYSIGVASFNGEGDGTYTLITQ